MEGLLTAVEKQHGAAARRLVEDALAFMRHAHEGQERADTTPFHKHPEAVAQILVDQRHADPELLVAALLHDVVEDTPVTLEAIRSRFGEEIAFLVDAVTDVGKHDSKSALPLVERTQRTHEKVLAAGQKDPRVFLIKTADRLHNLKTMRALTPERQRRLLHEAKEFHTKIARDVGAEQLAAILEEIVDDFLDEDDEKKNGQDPLEPSRPHVRSKAQHLNRARTSRRNP